MFQATVLMMLMLTLGGGACNEKLIIYNTAETYWDIYSPDATCTCIAGVCIAQDASNVWTCDFSGIMHF